MKKVVFENRKFVGAVNYVDGHRGCIELYNKGAKVGVKLYKSGISGAKHTPFYTAKYVSEAGWLADKYTMRYSGDALNFFKHEDPNDEGLYASPGRAALVLTLAAAAKDARESRAAVVNA